MPKPTYHIPQPKRLRRIRHSFAWIDHRLLRSEFVHAMTHQDQSLYLFLALAADQNGVSFYRREKASDILGLDLREFEVARDRLIRMDLLAFDPYSATSANGFYQLLPVDGRPPDFASMTPAAPAPSHGEGPPPMPPRIAPARSHGAAAPPSVSNHAPAAAWPASAAELATRLAAAFRTI